jgi:methyltransferase (TIGR00027 family)
MMVAYMRALADAGATHVRDFHDPTARVFLNARWTRRLAKVEAQLRTKRESIRLAFAHAAADLMAMRTKVIDAAVCDAVARGTRQLVILGAGLDGRAWRMRELAGVRVLEVDHPATQAVKRANLDKLPPSIAAVEFVSVDFEHQSLRDALARADHDAAQRTCWIWEGVVMYLTRAAMRSTLNDIASRSSPGSTIIVNYHTTMRRGIVGLILRALREPVRSAWSPAEMAEDLEAAGFAVREDSGGADWAARYAAGAVDLRAGRIMRVAVAATTYDARSSTASTSP